MAFIEDIVGKDDFFFKRNYNGEPLLGYKELASYVGNLPGLQGFVNKFEGKYIFLALSYDLKNGIYGVSSGNSDYFDFPDVLAFVPERVLIYEAGKWREINQKNNTVGNHNGINGICDTRDVKPVTWSGIGFKAYESGFNRIQEHIQRGDSYEVNYCIPFVADAVLDLFATYKKLERISQAPEGMLFRFKEWEHLGASPERFFSYNQDTIVSEPIKGTARRSENKEEDRLIKEDLAKNLKERTENIMVVDLVRNDIGKIALPGAVTVEKLCEIRSYKTVHQMVSKVVGKLPEGTTLFNVIEAMFPMGSMTGVPKKRTLEIIESVESFKRSLYSGSVGLISPDNQVDLNVVIRSLNYNRKTSTLSAGIGSAITSMANAEDEYKECLLKFDALKRATNGIVESVQ